MNYKINQEVLINVKVGGYDHWNSPFNGYIGIIEDMNEADSELPYSVRLHKNGELLWFSEESLIILTELSRVVYGD